MREVTRQDLANAVNRIIPLAVADLVKERTKELEAIEAAKRDHLDPGQNFWQRRHAAEQRVQALIELSRTLHGD